MAKITISQKVKQFIRLPGLNQQGQSIIIITFAILGLIAMLGLALDLGLVYIERTRLKRAVDASTLAGVVELPSEEQAFIRAINYLDENGYRLRDGNGNPQTNVYVRGCAHSSYLGSANFQNYHDTSTNPAGRPTVARDNDGDGDTETYYLYFPSTGGVVANPKAEFFVDTRTYQSTQSDAPGDFAPDSEQCDIVTNSLRGTANKIKIDGVIPVNMNFMQFFGFRQVPVWDEAIAQNITNLDVAIVFDISGSMQFDTVCYGCYEPYGDGSVQWENMNYGTDYPNPSFVNPIPSTHLPRGTMTDPNNGGVGSNAGNLCEGRDNNTVDYYTGIGAGSRRYVIIEGELYSLNTSVLYGPLRQPGSGYWAIQHTNWRTILRMEDEDWDPDNSHEVGASPILPSYSRGSWVAHHPYTSWAIGDVPFGHDYTLAEVQADPDGVPSLEYDFITSGQPTLLWNDSGDSRIWARVQAGGQWADTTGLYWAVYDYTDLQNNGAAGATPLNGAIQTPRTSPSVRGASYGGADGSRWRWIELTRAGLNLEDTARTKYTLKIWAGGPGYDIDQIVIGNANDTGFTTSYSSSPYAPARVQATAGSAFRQACNRCNAIYGLTVDMANCQSPSDNGWYDPLLFNQGQVGQDLTNPDINKLFSGYQPLRSAKEAVKRFISKLNPQFDQVGVASYSTDTPAAGRMELRCRRRYNADTCFQGTNPISFTEVLNVVERVPPNGSTNIARGMVRGLEMLGINANNLSAGAWAEANDCDAAADHCSRGGSARRIIILMTDGVANQTHNSSCDDVDLYTPNGADAAENRGKDCAMHYALIAAQNNITIYTIGLGNGVDTRFMETIAKLPGSDGEYFAAVSPAQLNDIFDTILNSISVRLIQ